MDDPLLNQEDNQNNEDSNEESDDSIHSNKWHIKYEDEKNFGKK